MSEDKSQEYFSDGMAQDLITDLSNVSGLLVIARNSSFSFRDKPMDVTKIAEQLDAGALGHVDRGHRPVAARA